MTIRGNWEFTVLIGLVLLNPSRVLSAPLQPTKPWVLDYAETECLAYREYGNPDHPLTLGVRPAPNGETYELLIGRQRSGPDFAEEIQGKVDFGVGPIKAWLLHFGDSKKKRDIYQYRISADEMAQAGHASKLSLRAEEQPDLAFSLEAMPALLKGLQDCNANLQQYWNMGAEAGGRIASLSKGDIRSIFSSSDYPGQALQLNQEGTAQYLLLIDEKGSVAACHVERASGVPMLDAMGCQAIRQRAKFEPARDVQGKGVRSMLITPPVTWRMSG
jgi:TonB family protein